MLFLTVFLRTLKHRATRLTRLPVLGVSSFSLLPGIKHRVSFNLCLLPCIYRPLNATLDQLAGQITQTAKAQNFHSRERRDYLLSIADPSTSSGQVVDCRFWDADFYTLASA
jgi:hypothetical protein